MADGSQVQFVFRGEDRPGVTSGLTAILGRSKARIIDLNQWVMSGRLSLAVLIECEDVEQVTKDALYGASKMGFQAEFTEIGENAQGGPWGVSTEASSSGKSSSLLQSAGSESRLVITLLARPLLAAGFSELMGSLAQHHFNIESIRRLASEAFSGFEIAGSLPVPSITFKPELMREALRLGIDIAIQVDHYLRRYKRLVVFDIDSTLLRQEVIDELGREAGCFEQMKAITDRAMQGVAPRSFEELLIERVALLKGLDCGAMDRVWARVQPMAGAHSLVAALKAMGLRVIAVSGGFLPIAQKLKTELGLDDVFANELEWDEDGFFTGKLRPGAPVIGPITKAQVLQDQAQRLGLRLDQTIAVGDGANDIPMLETAGLGVAFQAKPKVKQHASASIDLANLESILVLLGVSEREWRKS